MSLKIRKISRSMPISKVIQFSFLFFLCFNIGNSQISDWIAEKAADYIVNGAQKQLGSAGSLIWNSAVNSHLEENIKKESRNLSSILINKSLLDKVDKKYDMNKETDLYGKIQRSQRNKINSFYEVLKNRNFNTLAKGRIKTITTALYDSITLSIKENDLASLLLTAVIDSLKLPDFDKSIFDTILIDINMNHNLSFILNNHPDATRIYNNSLHSSLRAKSSHLLYWSKYADAHLSSLDKKNKIINPREIYFTEEKSTIYIKHKNQLLATQNDNFITPKTIDILNLNKKPNTKYVLSNTVFETDNLGRIVKVTQDISPKSPENSNLRSINKKMKFKIKSPSSNLLIYQPAFISFNAPICFINTLFLTKNASTKRFIKNTKKQMKEYLKIGDDFRVQTNIIYKDESDTFLQISVKFPNNEIQLTKDN